jgi:meso-butanediol dehydrogenase/(S,S)-butanediol dehydrogenase/diacetyl reductase
VERFKGKVVIVTGAASGIGEATARRFAAEGATVVLVDRDQAKLKKVADDLASGRTLSRATDISDSSAVDDLVTTTVKRFGRLDVLVNNAGVHVGGDPKEVSNDQWREVMATDLDGVFYGCRAALPHRENQRLHRHYRRGIRAWRRLGPTTQPKVP